MNQLLFQARMARRWSVTQAAQLIGISRSTYTRWEQEMQVPHDSSLTMACQAFQMSPEQLGFQLAAAQVNQLSLPESAIQREENAWRLSTQSFLYQQEEAAKLASKQKIVYDCLEVEVITLALHWKKSSGPLLYLQQLVSKALRNYDAMHQDDTRKDASLTRRQALQAIAVLPISLYGLTRTPLLPSQLSPEEMLPLCAAGLTACGELRQYEPEGIYAIGRILSAYLPTLEELSRQSVTFQRTAASLASQGYLLAGLLADHAGQLDQLEAASRMARLYAQVARDPNLEVAALRRLAIKYDFEHRDVKAMETYQEASALPGFSQVSPLLQGGVYLGLAETNAYCQQTSKALSFLDQAKEVFPQDAQSDPSYPFAICSEKHFALYKGLVLKHTGHYGEAINVFGQYGRLEPQSGLLEVHRAEHLNYTATVAVRQHNLDVASLYAEAAEEVAATIQHEQRQAEVRDTLRTMQLLWPQEPKVKQLREKIYSRKLWEKP
jgi:transcriptional regulator with XRE-family HTH domain